MQKIVLNFSLEKRALEAEEHVADCKRIISHLKSFDDLYKGANVVDVTTKTNYFFKDDLSDFNISKLNLIIAEQKDISYTNPDVENKELTAKSKSWMGFSTVIFFGGSSIESVPDITLHIMQGSIGSIPSFIKLEYSSDKQNRLSEEYVVALIREIVHIVNVVDMNAMSSHFFLKVRRKGYSAVGWVNYTRNKKVLTFLKSEEKKVEVDRGIVFSISARADFGADKQEVINRSIQISDFLGIK